MRTFENKSIKINKRLSILSQSEEQSIYGIPDFTKDEQRIYFSLNSAESEILKREFRGLISKIFFILQLGYFRAMFKFFSFNFNDVTNDTNFIIQHYFPNRCRAGMGLACNKKALLHHRFIIKKLYSYSDVTLTETQLLLKKAESFLLHDANPKYIFNELHSYLNKNRLILPGYTTMQTIISRAMRNYDRQIESIINNRLTAEDRAKIDNLLEKEMDHRYYLTLIKAPPNSFTFTQATKEREKRDVLDPIYQTAKIILKETGISQHSVKYYARLVDQFSIHRLIQLSESKRLFYILCFICYRYLKINDSLIKTFLYQVTRFNNLVLETLNYKISQLNIENRINFKKGSEVLDLITSGSLKDIESIGELRKQAFHILPKNKIEQLSRFLKKSDIDVKELRWCEFEKLRNKIRQTLRHIFKSTNFMASSDSQSAPLYDAIIYLQNLINNHGQKISDAPLGHVPKPALQYLYQMTPQGQQINAFRYEVFTYRMLKRKIDSADIFIPDSIEYRSMENDLVDKNFYARNKLTVHSSYENNFLSDSLLNRVEQKLTELDDLIHKTNQKILAAKNTSFKFTNDTLSKWHIDYQGTENKDINNPIFQKLPKIDLPKLLWFVNERTHYLDIFTHILYKDAKTKPDPVSIIAAMIAYATNMGLSKMASCSNITYSRMNSARDAFFREDTLRSINDILVNETTKLPIQELYKIGGTIHSSIDGKKYDAAGNIFNARYSPKYFNLGKGISILTLMINFLPVSMKIISPNEYEGNFGLELVLMNETNLQAYTNSTDMHGITDLNFALYDSIGFDFQPRYTNLFEASKSIVSSDKLLELPTNYIINPANAINQNLIVAEEDNIKRIVVSILSKTCSVSTIVKKLNSTLKSHQTRKAIAEYNKILRSIHILKSIDSLPYRQNIQKALNRGELYHYLTGEVGYANRGKILAKTELDQILYKECTRLVCNAILFYNCVILSRIYISMLKNGEHKLIELLKHISPIAWVNVNLYGTFDVKSYFDADIPDSTLENLKNNFQKNNDRHIP